MNDRQRLELLIWLLEQAKRQAEMLAVWTYHIQQAQGQAEQLRGTLTADGGPVEEQQD